MVNRYCQTYRDGRKQRGGDTLYRISWKYFGSSEASTFRGRRAETVLDFIAGCAETGLVIWIEMADSAGEVILRYCSLERKEKGL